MSYDDEQRKRRERWPWGDLAITDCEVIEGDDGAWLVRTTWPNTTDIRSVYTTKCANEQEANVYALMQQRGIYRQAHEPSNYQGRVPVLYAESDAVTEWDWVVASIPVPTLGGMQMGGCLIVDQSVHPGEG